MVIAMIRFRKTLDTLEATLTRVQNDLAELSPALSDTLHEVEKTGQEVARPPPRSGILQKGQRRTGAGCPAGSGGIPARRHWHFQAGKTPLPPEEEVKRLALLLPLLLISSCKQDSIGPLNGVLIVYSEDITEFIDSGGLEDIQIVVETVDPENVFSFSYASLPEFTGTLRERRIILMLLSPGDADEFPGGSGKRIRESCRVGIYGLTTRPSLPQPSPRRTPRCPPGCRTLSLKPATTR